MTMIIQWAGLTHVGRVRDHNEDDFFIDASQSAGFVADGMGGHQAGEVASALAVSVVRQSLADGLAPGQALEHAHQAILAHPNGGGVRGMGTTGVLVVFHDRTARVAWVGDSRAYLFQDGNLLPLSKDHTPVQEMVDRGVLTPAQARLSSRRNEVSQALGIGAYADMVRPGLAQARLGPGDVVLLCSDGLTEHLDDAQIQELLRQGTRDLEKAVVRLVEAALADGGVDNITVILAKALAD